MDRVRPSKNIPEIAKSTKSARDSSTFDIPLLSPLRVMELIPSLSTVALAIAKIERTRRTRRRRTRVRRGRERLRGICIFLFLSAVSRAISRNLSGCGLRWYFTRRGRWLARAHPWWGPRRHPIRLAPVQEGRRQASKEAEGERDVRHNLAIIPLFIPGAPAALGHLNLLNTRRLVHFIKPRVCTRAIHFPLSRFFPLSLLFFLRESLFFSHLGKKGGGGGTRNTAGCRITYTIHGNPIRDRGRETSIRVY